MEPGEEYMSKSVSELSDQIALQKDNLGDDLVILGHHYQRDEVIAHADFTGDSLKLARLAAEQEKARWIVFCGVHFMAESADILSRDDQIVCLPNLRAGCAMAEMADAQAVSAALEEIASLTDAKTVPITYVNSTAAIKAVTAIAGGACCTSGNVESVFAWALADVADGGAGAEKIFAIPDRHLGQNTAVAMGFDDEQCAVYDPALPNGGLTAEKVHASKFILWQGHCYVHQVFKVDHIQYARKMYPDAKIMVHPECCREVVALADEAGSTEKIIQAVAQSPAGSSWVIATEGNLVNRLAKHHSDKSIRLLSPGPASCAQMARIDLPHLAWVLDNLADGKIVNQITVEKSIADKAHQAVQRMIEIKP